MIVDIIVAGFVVIFVFQGLGKGLIRMLVDLLAVVGATFFAWQTTPRFSGYLLEKFPQEFWKTIPTLSFFLLWMGMFWGVIAIGYFLVKWLTPLLLKPVDKLAGAVFGGLKGAIYMIPVILFFGTWQVTEGQGEKVVQPTLKFLESRDITVKTITDSIQDISKGHVESIQKLSNELSDSSPSSTRDDTILSILSAKE